MKPPMQAAPICCLADGPDGSTSKTFLELFIVTHSRKYNKTIPIQRKKQYFTENKNLETTIH